MNRFLAKAAVLLLLATTLSVWPALHCKPTHTPEPASIQSPEGFAGTLFKSTFALYATEDGDTRFICTATAYEQIPGGYHLIGAGHCIDGSADDVTFSVSEDIGGDRMPVKVLKFRLDQETNMDFAQFELLTERKYPTIDLGNEADTHIGDGVVMANFTFGMAKQLSIGFISSSALTATSECPDEGCVGDFLVQTTADKGASGSSVVSTKTGQVIGICVFGFRGNLGMGVEPISLFQKFLSQQSQIREPKKVTSRTKSVKIPDDVFARLFGPEHPFKLEVHGGNLTFMQAGHAFYVETNGLDLSEGIYYDVPVYIDIEDGIYRLVSTAEPHYSVVIISLP